MRNHDDAGPERPQEMLQQNLCSQIQKVGGFVQQQQIGLVQQKGRQLDSRLPASGQLGYRPR